MTTSRRSFLSQTAVAFTPGIGRSPAVQARQARDNPVVEENRRKGTAEWQLQYTAFDYPPAWEGYPMIRGLRSTAVEGYCSRTSVAQGESLDVKISTDRPVGVLIDIYRIGYYGGRGGRHMTRLGPFRCGPQSLPSMTVQRLRECRWETTTTVTVPSDWPSGVYLGKLTREEPFGRQNYVVFVVKDRRRADLLFQCSDMTWQAYNKWPGRDSLYDDGTDAVWTTSTEVRVSFDRPYTKYCQILDAPLSSGSGEFLLWEYPFAYWLEMEGYDATYCSNLDLELDPGVLDRCRAFLSVGHDEYWTRRMYDRVLAARDRGLHLGFFSGNSLCWEVEASEASESKSPARVMRRRRLFPDEDLLMGTKSYGSGYGDWVVRKASHWIYERTGMADGDAIRGLIGWEYHATPAKLAGLEVVASAPLYPPQGWDGETTGRERLHKQRHEAVVFPAASGATVFNAGTIWWAEGLSHPIGHMPARYRIAASLGPDERVQQITRNVLDRFIRER